MATISAEEFLKGGSDIKLVKSGSEGPNLDGFEKASRFAMPSLKEVGTEMKNVATGAGKGLIEGGRAIDKGLQGLGQRTLAAIDPTKNLAEVRKETGLESLKGDKSAEIDEQLKAKNTGEKVGKALEFIGELLMPTGSRKLVEKGLEKGASLAGDIGSGGAKIASEIGDTASKATEGIRDVVKPLVDSASRIPSRIATNAAEKKATRMAIEKLPSKTAQNAVHEGIDINDAGYISKIPNSFKPAAKKLVEVVQKFAKGETKTNPIEVVGKPIVNRLKELEKARSVVGEKLGEVAANFGDLKSKNLFPEVFTELRKVPGLNGIKVGKKGVLDFTDTVLTTAETKADRQAIQKIFVDAIKPGSGKSKHLLRQELFEVLGGKKRALTSLTDTQEKAYQAVRKGLSKVLESKNPTYKTLSNEYRKIAQPLQDLRKVMKNIPEATEDILDMQGGLLARRLTSAAQSNPQIRAILKAMDSATKVPGKAKLSVEGLQDFYNILDKYYDIAPKTGFQSQIKSGVEKASGIVDLVVGTARDVAGKSQATRTKALENLLNEILSK